MAACNARACLVPGAQWQVRPARQVHRDDGAGQVSGTGRDPYRPRRSVEVDRVGAVDLAEGLAVVADLGADVYLGDLEEVDGREV